MCVDKILLKFVSDVMYLKGVINFDELEDIMNCCDAFDLDMVFDKMMRGEYNAYRRGDFTITDGGESTE